MEDAWFTGLADELARCLVDAETCADACERLLEAVVRDGEAGHEGLRVALVVPAAVARVLGELIDEPPQLVLAAARLCRDRGAAAIAQVEALGGRIDGAEALAALRASVESCSRLLDAAPSD
jgi:hypothetical protein